ncbi:hypothetical protein D3C85_1745550 [compost metagenome]
MGAVYRLGLEQQIVEWQGKQGLDLGEGPVVTKGVAAQGESIHTWLPVVISGILRRPSRMNDHRTRHASHAILSVRSQVAEIVG